jgi:hypothetical protein
MDIKKSWNKVRNTRLMRRLGKVAKRAKQYAGYMREDAISNLKGKADQIGKVFMESEKPSTHAEVHRERPFGRENSGADVKHIVWAGHTVRNSEQQSQYGAVGLTESGYYRSAQVQNYGGIEKWNWSAERHVDKKEAISVAESKSTASLLKKGGAKKVVDRSSVIAEMDQNRSVQLEKAPTGSLDGKNVEAVASAKQKVSSTGPSRKYGRPAVPNKAQPRREGYSR